jgi:hypothetical protein
LLGTHTDHLKVLMCEAEDKSHPKMTPEAQQLFEVEKQNQIKQYMEDIISKLQQKDRRFKVTSKKKFIEDALSNSTASRVASVYVVVINRGKTNDPSSCPQALKSRKYLGNAKFIESSTDEDEPGL